MLRPGPTMRLGPLRADRTLVALAGGLAAALGVVYALAVLAAPGQRIDNLTLGDFHSGTGLRDLDLPEAILAPVSAPTAVLLGAGCIAVALLRRRADLALAAGVLMVGANLTSQLLKPLLTRPDLAETLNRELTTGLREGTFPSGHVMVVVALGMALTLVASPAARPAAATIAAMAAAATGAAVLALNWHRPSDVVGAYLIGAAWMVLVTAFIDRRRVEPGTGRAAWAAAGVSAVLGLVATLFLLALGWGPESDTFIEERSAFVLGSVAVAVCAVAVSWLALAILPSPPLLHPREPHRLGAERPG
ncbi:MAG: phosphatase PAP2 family protein [Miltoncostaeaceae bacterium]